MKSGLQYGKKPPAHIVVNGVKYTVRYYTQSTEHRGNGRAVVLLKPGQPPLCGEYGDEWPMEMNEKREYVGPLAVAK